MKNFCAILVLTLALISLGDAGNTKEPEIHEKCGYKFQLFSRAAANRRRIRGTVRAFERMLGGIDNCDNPGRLESGRRSINWDEPEVPFRMPFNFFDRNVTRGAVFRAAKQEFRVSNPVPRKPVDNKFNSILQRRLSREFKPFSPKRLFTPFERNRLVQIFKIPGKNKRANTAGFGAVFIDVDRDDSIYMDFYTKTGCLLWRLFIPARNKGISFGGIYIMDKKPAISKVVFKLGTESVRVAGLPSYVFGSEDIVILDDLIWGEPM